MEYDSQLASRIDAGEFIVTAEYLPTPSADSSEVEKVKRFFNTGLTAVSVADNPHGPVMSSLAGSVALRKSGVEPVYQIGTRDRNRIAIQSDLLGAVSLGIRNVLCLSGYHPILTSNPESSNVYDLDPVQLVAAVDQMNAEGTLLNGTPIDSKFSVLAGATANPDLKPLELNMIRLAKKVAAGAAFIQTQAVFDIDTFQQWIEAAQQEGITEKTAILAGVMPIQSVAEAQWLKETYTDFNALDRVVERLQQAGDADAQKKEGMRICAEIVNEIRAIRGLRGIHIISGGKENIVPDVIEAAGL